MNSISFITLGCKVNQYETYKAAQSIEKLPINIRFSFDKNSDFFYINTCSVTHIADRKSRQYISRALKQKNSKIFITGCYLERIKEDILNYFKDNSDRIILIPNQKKENFIDYIKPFINEKINQEDNNKEILFRYRAYLKVQDGCDKFCAYCIIPHLRGRSRSVKLSQVVQDFIKLQENGYKEIVITGICLSDYGKDINSSLYKLLKTLLKYTNKDVRLRLSSLEIKDVKEDLFSLIQEEKRLCRHLHFSLQSGSNKILKLMKRDYTQEEFLFKINKAKQFINGLGLTTDVIVGFPEESDKNFLDTYNFIKKAGFTRLHVFKFSPRPHTYAAYKYKDNVSAKQKKERVEKLIKLNNELQLAFIKNIFKTSEVIEVLFDQKEGNFLTGYTDNYIKVYTNQDLQLGNIYNLKPTTIFKDGLAIFK